METFNDSKLSSNLKKSIATLGFSEPTEIQAKSIPEILKGNDVLGESATGSGKTLAFGCGVIEATEPGQGIQALVLAPTRELAEQVKKSIHELSIDKKLKIISIYGGVSINPQIDDLEIADIVVGTPGRMNDHIGRQTIDLSNLKILVLDEADRMLDMGFIEDIEKIMDMCPEKRQTLFFSATFSQDIERLARRYLHDPIKITATRMVDPDKLTQVYYDVQRGIKFSLLVHLLKKEENAKLIMVFCNTRRATDMITKSLKAQKIEAEAIHGGFTQAKRNQAIKNFKDGKINVLVCTDVAARGIHVDDVSHIYNYDMPNDPTEYVHRIGRTARAGDEGQIINIVCDMDYDNFGRVLDMYTFDIQKANTPKVERVELKREERQDSRGGRGGYSRGGDRRGPPRGGSRGGSGRGPRTHGSSRSSGSSSGSSGGSRRPPRRDD